MEQKIDSSKKYPNWIIAAAIVFLVASNFLTAFLFKNQAEKSRAQNYFSLLNPARTVFEQKDLIVNIQPLREELNAIGNDQNISIYFEFLNTGANISINKDLQIWPASLMKIPIAMAAVKKVEKGGWSFAKEFTLKEEDRNPIFGDLHKKPVGAAFSLSELLDEILINSDNTARNIIARHLTFGDFGDVIDHIGVDFDYQADSKISAKRYAVLWRSLFNATYLTPENSQRLIEIMRRSSAHNFLAPGVPDEIPFSHKIGVLYDENTYADSGIVYIPSRPYILTVMVSGKSQEESERIMQEISAEVYKYISEYQ